jgi:ribosome-associated protein
MRGDLESGTDQKRQGQELHRLGELLIALPTGPLEAAGAHERLLEAIVAARPMQRGALRRQTLYIARLLREASAEVPLPLRRLVAAAASARGSRAASLHLVERWRARLLDRGDAAGAELLEAYPLGNRQQLAQLVRSAQAEAGATSPAPRTGGCFAPCAICSGTEHPAES